MKKDNPQDCDPLILGQQSIKVTLTSQTSLDPSSNVAVRDRGGPHPHKEEGQTRRWVEKRKKPGTGADPKQKSRHPSKRRNCAQGKKTEYEQEGQKREGGQRGRVLTRGTETPDECVKTKSVRLTKNQSPLLPGGGCPMLRAQGPRGCLGRSSEARGQRPTKPSEGKERRGAMK